MVNCMITINILGSCICRDIFEIGKHPDEDVIFSIEHFYQFSNPFVYTRQKPEKLIDIDLFRNMKVSNFYKKCILGDYNKVNLESCLEGAEYFVFDLTEFRFEVGQILGNYITYTEKFKKAFNYIFPDKDISEIDIICVSLEEKKKSIDILVKRLLTKYEPDKIILLENYLVGEYFDDINSLFYVGNEEFQNKINDELKQLYLYVKEKYKDINVISVSKILVGDINHKWGKDALHYMNNYYKVAYEKIKCLVLYNYMNNSYIFEELFEKSRKNYLYQNLDKNISRNNIICDNSLKSINEWRIISSKGNGFEYETGKLICNQGYLIIEKRNIEINNLQEVENVCFSVCGTIQGNVEIGEVFLSFGFIKENKFCTILADKKRFSNKKRRKAITINLSGYKHIDSFACRIYAVDCKVAILLEKVRIDYGTIPNDIEFF